MEEKQNGNSLTTSGFSLSDSSIGILDLDDIQCKLYIASSYVYDYFLCINIELMAGSQTLYLFLPLQE